MRYKIPESVLVVIYTPALDVLLIHRADMDVNEPDFWQSVTGSKDKLTETFAETAAREVHEETGIVSSAVSVDGAAALLLDWQLENVYDIYPRWAHRYAPGISCNTEHLFGLQVPVGTPIHLNPREHTALIWLPWREAAQRCYSPSNAEAILMLPRFL